MTQRFLLLMVVLTSTFALAGPHSHAQDNTEQSLHLVIALDRSASMSQRIDGNNNDLLDTDASHLLMFVTDSSLRGLGTPATDPDDVRYTLVETLGGWLYEYEQRPNNRLDLSLTVIGFDNQANVLTDDLGPTVTVQRPGAVTAEGRHADFINLYAEIETALSDSTAERQAVIVITDSPPCNPNGPTSVNGRTVRNSICDGDVSGGALPNHIAVLPSLDAASETLFFVTPGEFTLQDFWDEYDDTLSAWQSRTNRTGSRFERLANIEALPRLFMETVMREMALAQGVLLPEEADEPLSDDIYGAMGILHSAGDSFDVPPYQTRLDLLLRVADNTRQLDFLQPTDEEAEREDLVDNAELRLQRVRFTNPEAGAWQVQTQSVAEVWALLRPARARYTLVPENPVAYQPFRVQYQLLDEESNPLPIGEALQPDFSEVDLRLPIPNGRPVDAALSMEPNSTGNSLTSDPFVPVLNSSANTSYGLIGAVQPGSNNLWTPTLAYDFLQPPPLRITVRPMTFDTQFTVAPQSVPSSGVINFPRSLTMQVDLLAEIGNTAVDLPQGLTIDAAIIPNRGFSSDTCPAADREVEGFCERFSFETPDEYEVTVSGTFRSQQPPLSGDDPVTIDIITRSLSVDPTTRVTVALLDENREALTLNDETSVTMYQRAPLPAPELNTLTLFFEVRDENGEREQAQFLCGDDNTPCGTDVVPYQLRVTDSASNDVAAQYDIALARTDEPGRYRVEIRGLPRDNYTLTLVNPAETVLDYREFEYLEQRLSAEDDTDILSIALAVNFDPLLLGQIAAISAVVILLLLFWWRASNQRRNGLRGSIAIYRISQAQAKAIEDDAIEAEAEWLWQMDWPRRISYTITPDMLGADADVRLLGIRSIEATTRSEKALIAAEGAYITMDMHEGTPPNNQRMEAGQMYQIKEMDGYVYYIVQTPSPDLTVEQLLTQPAQAL